MKLFDSTFLIEYLNGDHAVSEYLEANQNAEFTTTAHNIREIAVGQELSGGLDPAATLVTFEWLRIIPFSTEHAFAAARLEADLHRDETVNQDYINSVTTDLLIAAVGRVEGATVVTRNITDFERFGGVDVETY